MQKRYSKSGLLSLFLAVAFPLHLWTLLLVFADITWLAERTNLWDAAGTAAYALLYALAESVLVFLALAALGFLLPRRWKEQKRIAILSVLFYIATLFVVLGQLHFVFGWMPGAWMAQLLASSGRPLVFLYLMALALIGAVLLPALLWLLRFERAAGKVMDVLDRLAVLSLLYLSFDLLALILVIVRNI